MRNNKFKRHKKRLYKRTNYAFAVGAIVFLFLCYWVFSEIVSVKPAKDWYEVKVTDKINIVLPQDDAPHEKQMEWWYYNGLLRDTHNHTYSFHFTVFQVSNIVKTMVSHVSFTDHQTKKHYTDQHRTGGNLSTHPKNAFNFKMGQWKMTGDKGNDTLTVLTDDFGFDLKLNSVTEPIIHGEEGILDLKEIGSSYYYSRPRLLINGDIKIAGKNKKVKGMAWFDHQWGDFSTTSLAWDWFSLQLEGGKDLMIYQLRDKLKQPVLYTMSISQKGKTTTLDSNEFSLQPSEHWTSKKTGLVYPMNWQLEAPKLGLKLNIKSVNEESEFDATLTTYNVYWEGAVVVEGSDKGKGFIEMSGYNHKTNKLH